MALFVPLLARLGHFIGRWPTTVFIVNLLLSLPWLSYFCLFEPRLETDVRRGFAHRDGRSTHELQAFGDFYNISMDDFELLMVFLEAKAPQTEMDVNTELLDDIERLDKYINGISMEVLGNEESNKNGSMKMLRLDNLQTARGDINFLFHAYKWAHGVQARRLAQGQQLDPQIRLGYPLSRIYGFDVPMGSHFFGVRTGENNKNASTTTARINGTEVAIGVGKSEQKASELLTAQHISMFYMFEGRGPRMRDALAQLEWKLFRQLNNIGSKEDGANFSSTHFDVHIYADEIANFELIRGCKRTIQLLSVGVTAMVVFMLFIFRAYCWKSQLILIFLSLLSPTLAICVTFALMGWLGVKLNAIMSVMPFLVFGIGVDNAFLLLHSWRKATEADEKKRKALLLQQDAPADVPQRMALVIAEMGPSIAITSLTNGLAFGVGIFSPSSLMASFCLCTTVAIGLDFLFEFFVFAPCLPLIRWTPETKLSKGHKLRTAFCRAYSKFIVSRWSKAVTVLLLLFGYIAAFFGIGKMEASFEPRKMFSSDSPLQTSLAIINRAMEEHSPVTFLVFNPPDIGERSQLDRFNQMISTLEALPNTQHIDLWLRAYLEYDRKNRMPTAKAAIPAQNGTIKIGDELDGDYRPSYGLAPRYLRDRRMHDKGIVQFSEHDGGNNVTVERFMFVLSRRGELSWHQRALFVGNLRSIVDQFGEFNVTVFDYDATIYDLILMVKTEMLKSVLVTLTCMSLVCFFLIPNARNTSIATFSVLSIAFTMMGALGWWEFDIDPVTMINMLMGIGFSVDFSAHICYHFHKRQLERRHRQGRRQLKLIGHEEKEKLTVKNSLTISEDDDEEKRSDGAVEADAQLLEAQQSVEAALKAVGRPMLEAAGSTMICTFPLFFLSIYITSVFARTVLCVSVIGIVHGLFIVPVLLSLQIGQKSVDDKGKDDCSSASATSTATSSAASNSQQQQQPLLLLGKGKNDADGDSLPIDENKEGNKGGNT